MADSIDRGQLNGHEGGPGIEEVGPGIAATDGHEDLDDGTLEDGLRLRGRKLQKETDGESRSRQGSSSSSRSPKREFMMPECASWANQKKDRYIQELKEDPSKPIKTFDEHVKEYEKKKMGSLGRQKTMDDYDYNPAKAKRNKNQPTDYTRFLTFFSILLAVAAVLGGFWWFVFTDSSSTKMTNTVNAAKKSWEDIQKLLFVEIQSLHKEFPSQTTDTWVHILSAVESTMARIEPKQPSSIVVLVPPKLAQSSFPNCFAQRLAKLTNDMFSELNATTGPSVFSIDSKYFQTYGQDITFIHNQLRHYFRSGGRSVVVQDVEKIQKEEHLLIFHGVCDNYMAPEKRATLFFIVPVPPSVFTKRKWSNERASELSYEILDNAWKSTSNDDARPAMISRIAASVVLLNEGDTCK